MIVVDASAAAKWVLDEADSDRADQLRLRSLAAPSILLSEVANAIWKRCTRGLIAAEDAVVALTRVNNVVIRSEPLSADAEAALRLALALRHPVYDCFYLACAIRLDTHVVTADRRFHDVVSRRPELAGRIRLLGVEAA